jgi:hypothetical protein
MPFHVIDGARLKMRVKETERGNQGRRMGVERVEGIYLTFRTKELTPHVYFRNMRIEVSTFVAAIQCYKCGKFGHISKFCTKEEQCFSCGEVKHQGSYIKNA